MQDVGPTIANSIIFCSVRSVLGDSALDGGGFAAFSEAIL